MARNDAPVVAELGRPETADETAARKAASSAVYRSSQTLRNLIVALLITVGVVVVILIGVPRGQVALPDSIDPAPAASQAAEAYGRAVVVPEIPAEWRTDDEGQAIEDAWRVNRAALTAEGGTNAWAIVYAPPRGFLHVSQGFDADEAWARTVLRGTAASDTVMIDGIEWDVYTIARPADAGNISYALGTQAGPDHILVYGSSDAQTAADLAGLLTEQVRELRAAS